MSPGNNVVFGRSTVVAPAGARTSATGPTAAIFSPVTSTTHPACGSAVTPSNTRAGRRRTLRTTACCASAGGRPVAWVSLAAQATEDGSTARRTARNASIAVQGRCEDGRAGVSQPTILSPVRLQRTRLRRSRTRACYAGLRRPDDPIPRLHDFVRAVRNEARRHGGEQPFAEWLVPDRAQRFAGVRRALRVVCNPC